MNYKSRFLKSFLTGCMFVTFFIAGRVYERDRKQYSVMMVQDSTGSVRFQWPITNQRDIQITIITNTTINTNRAK